MRDGPPLYMYIVYLSLPDTCKNKQYFRDYVGINQRVHNRLILTRFTICLTAIPSFACMLVTSSHTGMTSAWYSRNNLLTRAVELAVVLDTPFIKEQNQ